MTALQYILLAICLLYLVALVVLGADIVRDTRRWP
jgi:hypothetical protein